MSTKLNIPLTSFQTWMQQMLLDPHGQTDVVAQQLLPKALHDQDIRAVINDSERLPAHEHLAIYQRSYIARLRDCMAQQFSTLEYALGKELFCGFADNYLEQYPSTNYNLTHLGRNFANYLEASRPDKDAPVKEDWPDFMIELARFEYAINVIFDEKADENYSLATESTPEQELKLIPVFYAFDFKFPIRGYYGAFINDKEPELPHPQESYCVILRHKYKLALFDLHPEQFHFLKHMKEGHSAAEAKQHMISAHGVSVERLESVWPAWKKNWIESDFFRAHIIKD